MTVTALFVPLPVTARLMVSSGVGAALAGALASGDLDPFPEFRSW